jgi:antitoxin HicB
MNNTTLEQAGLEYYLSLNYPITLYSDPDGGFVVEIKDLPGCISQAETADEALEMVEDARRLWLETAYINGDSIPLPSTDTRYSGKTMLRMPRSLHQDLAEAAKREGVSLNQLLVSLLSQAITRHQIEGKAESSKRLAKKNTHEFV